MTWTVCYTLWSSRKESINICMTCKEICYTVFPCLLPLFRRVSVIRAKKVERFVSFFGVDINVFCGFKFLGGDFYFLIWSYVPLCVYFPLRLFIYLFSFFFFLSVYVCLCLTIYPSVHIFAFFLTMYYPSIYLYPSFRLNTYISIYLSIQCSLFP